MYEGMGTRYALQLVRFDRGPYRIIKCAPNPEGSYGFRNEPINLAVLLVQSRDDNHRRDIGRADKVGPHLCPRCFLTYGRSAPTAATPADSTSTSSTPEMVPVSHRNHLLTLISRLRT